MLDLNSRLKIFEGVEHEALLGYFVLTQPGATVYFARPEESLDPKRRAKLIALLSDDEKRRLSRLQRESEHHLFLLAHALTRLALSRHADVDPSAWQFSAGDRGRPEVALPSCRLRFSLSHTRGLAACAVTADHDVGLDVQDISKGRSSELAARFFSARELNDLGRAPAAQRAVRFFEYWTLKEAYLKARGAGLSVPLDSFSFYQDGRNQWRITFATPTSDNPDRWEFWSWRVRAGHQAALAVAMTPRPCQPQHNTERRDDADQDGRG